jgi:hypothetical protein
MLKTYEAIYDHGNVRWLDTPPDAEGARLLVTVLPSGTVKPAATGVMPAKSLEDALKAVVLLNPYRDAVDPVAWQRDIRNERALPGRD